MTSCYNTTNNIKEKDKIYKYFLSGQNILDILTAYDTINKIKIKIPAQTDNIIKYSDIVYQGNVETSTRANMIDLKNLFDLYNNFMAIVHATYNYSVNKYNEYFNWNLKNLQYHPIKIDPTLVSHTSEIDRLHSLLINNVNTIYDKLYILLNPIDVKSFENIFEIF